MTPLTIWFAVGAVVLIATALWAIAARQTAVYITSAISFVGWSWLSLTAGDVALITDTGATVWVRQSLAPIQFVAVSMAVISLVVFVMRLMGAYPSPEQNAAADDQKSTNRTQT